MRKYLGVLGCVFLIGGNVGSLGGIGGQTLVLVPCIPLGFALQIQCTGFGSVVITDGSLLVETVELEELIVGGSLGEFLGFLGGGVELYMVYIDKYPCYAWNLCLLLTSMF